jgi:hypothetical protein
MGAAACPGTLQLRITYVPANEGSAAMTGQASATDIAHHARHERGASTCIRTPSESFIATIP